MTRRSIVHQHHHVVGAEDIIVAVGPAQHTDTQPSRDFMTGYVNVHFNLDCLAQECSVGTDFVSNVDIIFTFPSLVLLWIRPLLCKYSVS